MDQETQRLLITATASFAAGLFSALIGFASAQRVARHTLAGQRKLASDAALREHRAQQVRALRERVSEI